MSTVAEILDAVKKLDQDQKDQFLRALSEIDFEDAWDRRMEADAIEGKLDHLWGEAMSDIQAGRTKPLDEILGEH